LISGGKSMDSFPAQQTVSAVHYTLWSRAGLTLLLLFGGVLRLQAQGGVAQISGIVKDSSGAVIPGASVSAVNERTGALRTVLANDQGHFVIPSLQPSLYTVKAGAPGFALSETKGVAVLAGESVPLQLVLKPGGITESITVIATQEPIIDTSSARIGANVNEREVGELPLNGRQLSQLYLQAPGSVNTGSGSFFDVRFSGRSNEENAIRYDGIEGGAVIDSNPGNLNGEISSPFRLQTSLENVQEFRVDSSNYPAEYGTGTGGQVSVITRSGSSQFHGSAFEYLRNDMLDARNFFDRTGKSPLRLNQFGGSLGGPIRKDKLFFFASYEGYRLRSGINIVEAVPSLAEKARAVPAIAPLIDAFRGPGSFLLPGASTNPDFDILQLQSNVGVDENAGTLRLDYRLNDRYSMYVRYMRDQGETTQPEGVTGRITRYRTVPQNAVLTLQGTLTQRLLNEFKFGYNGALTRVAGSAPTVNGIDLSQIAINLSGSVANTGIAGQGASSGIAVPGGLIRGSSAFNGRGFPYTPYSLSFIDNLSWVKGNHNFKFGTEVRLLRLYLNILGGTTYSYSNLNDFLANKALQIQYGGDLSDPSPFNGGATGNRFAKTEFYIGYAQDEWKLRPGLTLSYGLRYEYYRPLREDRNLDVQFDMQAGGLFPPDRSFFKSLKTNFGPRLGIAWSPGSSRNGLIGGGKTVLRAGFGMYYGPGQIEDQIQPVQNDRISVTQSGGSYPIDIQAVRNNFVSNPDNRQYQPRAYDANYAVPERIYQYSLSLQQELPYKFNMTLAYVGSQGRNLFLRSVTNRITQVVTNADPTKTATVIREFDIVNPDGTVLRPFAEVDYKTSGGWDSYDAMQISFGRRFTTGLTLNSQYTWGRSYGNSSGSNDAQTSSNPYDFDFENGYNSFDVRQSFNLSAVYSLPFAKNRGGTAGTLLGGWDVGAIINARTGLPIDLKVVRNDIVYRDGTGNFYNSPAAGRIAVINTPGGGASRNVRRPDVLPGVNPFLDTDRALLNPAAFTIPEPGTFGNQMRGALHGPDFRQCDLMLNKRFRVTESSRIEFRAEFFNIFNLTNFANPPATLPNVLGTGTNQLQPGQPYTAAAAGSFGVLNQTVERTVGQGTNRQIQFALRYSF
jgi:hypothetical protein